MTFDLDNIVNEIAQKKDIKDSKLKLELSTIKGDGYLGNIKFGKIVGSNKSIDVVFKCAHREAIGIGELIHNVYLNEIWFYEAVAPAFKTFQAEHHINDPYDNYPKFYASCKETLKEAMCLENLKTRGFDMWDRTKLMNEEHLKCAIGIFAKYHGTSYAMQRSNPNLYKKLADGIEENLFIKVFESIKCFDQVGNIMKRINSQLFTSPQDKHIFNKIEAISTNVSTEFEKIIQCDDHNVILQGDCWCSNALYEYDSADRSAPKSMKMLDFQLMHIGSPVLDLSYFFYATASKECCNKLDYFLKMYHDALAEHLAKFGLQTEDVFTFDQLCKHWKDLAKFGMYLTFGVRKMMLVESKNAPNLTENPDTFLEVMKLTPEIDRIYLQQMKDLIMHFEERKFI